MFRMAVFLLMLVFLASCGKSDEAGSQTASNDATPVVQERPPGRPAIPDDDFSEEERIINASLSPFFDAEGTKTEATIAPGEYFGVYVFAEYNEAFPMAAAEWRLVLPAEVSVMGVAHDDTTTASVGKHEQDFGIAFPCIAGPRWWIVKYTCKAHEEFNGGVIELTRGTGLDFIGFVTCDNENTMIRAKGGTAVLKKK